MCLLVQDSIRDLGGVKYNVFFLLGRNDSIAMCSSMQYQRMWIFPPQSDRERMRAFLYIYKHGVELTSDPQWMMGYGVLGKVQSLWFAPLPKRRFLGLSISHRTK